MAEPMRSDWYECIEEPVRELVQHLRGQGFNTVSSCGHIREVQIDYTPDGELKRLYDVLWNYLVEKEGMDQPEFQVKFSTSVVRGNCYSFVTVTLPKVTTEPPPPEAGE